MESFYLHHVLHSLSIAKYIDFKPETQVLDVGTGGGFPGIPLAILFPEVSFHLIDSIGKKIKVVKAVAEALGLKNVNAEQVRVEDLEQKYDFVVSRAVTDVKTFYYWTRKRMNKVSRHKIDNGLILLKGGDLKEEFADLNHHHRFTDIKQYFTEEYFETKKIAYVKM
jgi:16S rRNA (guanine527-N7)-methyltransferase